MNFIERIGTDLATIPGLSSLLVLFLFVIIVYLRKTQKPKLKSKS
jgi:hypothetical protein